MIYIKKSEKQEKKEKKEKVAVSPLRPTTVKNLVKSIIEEDTQIEPDAVINLQKVLIEISKWIVIDAEKLARYKGTKRITVEQIKASTRNYLGDKE